MNDNGINGIVSLGQGWRSAPREWWGSRDREQAERERRAFESYQPFGPGAIAESPHSLKSFGGFFDRPRPRPSAQSIAADVTLRYFGVR